MPETKVVNSIIRGASILRILGEGVTRVEDIYKRVGLSRSSTHRLLKSLVAAGFAYQNPVDRSYHVGSLVLQLASDPLISHQALLTCVESEIRFLRDLVGETVLIIIANGNQRFVLAQIPSPQKLAYNWYVGATGFICIGSSGKVLLSQLSDPHIEQILQNINFPSIVSSTNFSADILRHEIKRVREEGFATSIGEDDPGSIGISTPIRGYTIPVALCILAPEFRVKPINVLSKMNESSTRIEEKLRAIFQNK
jgi:DNA-binding IclR family transcriptional regulator